MLYKLIIDECKRQGLSLRQCSKMAKKSPTYLYKALKLTRNDLGDAQIFSQVLHVDFVFMLISEQMKERLAAERVKYESRIEGMAGELKLEREVVAQLKEELNEGKLHRMRLEVEVKVLKEGR
jgi:hypothetical protein